MKKNIFLKLVIFILLLACGSLLYFHFKPSSPKAVKIGYFHGGRTMIMYRAKYFDYFENEKIDVQLVTKHLRDPNWFVLPKKIQESEYSGKDDFGKATGLELVDLIVKGQVDGATIGESAFLKAVEEKKPIVAVAELGYDLTERPGHGIVLRNDIKIKNKKDLEKLVWGARRSAGGDEMYLKDFLRSEGVDLNKVKIISNIDDDKMISMLKNNKFQGAYYHLTTIRTMLKKNLGYIYRRLDWRDAQTSQALLVFSKDYLKKNPESVKKVVAGLMKRVSYENSLPLEERRKSNSERAFELATEIEGMDFPHFRDIPTIRKDILLDMQDMLFENNFLSAKSSLDSFFDNSFVNEIAAEQLKNAPAFKDYRGPLFDSMTQWESTSLPLASIIEKMKGANVYKMGITIRKPEFPGAEDKALKEIAVHQDLLVPLAPKLFKGKPFLTDKNIGRFVDSLKRNKYPAVAEIMYRHADKKFGANTKNNETYINPLSPESIKLISEIQKLNLPVFIHWEFYKWDRDKKDFFALFKKFPHQIFIIAHMGFGSVDQIEEVLTDYPNVMATISKRNKRFDFFQDDTLPQGSSLLGDNKHLRTEWKNFLINFRSRLLFATDSHKSYMWNNYDEIIQDYRNLLGELPLEAAELIAFKNAEHLFKQ